MDGSLRTWLTETAYYAIVDSVSASGDPVYGDPVSFTCRTEYDVMFHGPMFLPRHGEEQESFTRIFTETEIPLDALIWPPGSDEEDVTLAFRAKRREVIRDDLGRVVHYEIYF